MRFNIQTQHNKKNTDWLIALPFEVHVVLLILQITLQSWKSKIPGGAEKKMSKRCILGQVFN